MPWLIWIGIAFCLTQSATLSGLNLACFRVSRLHLEIEAGQGNPHAARLLALRRDANFLLVTVLWGNVAVNVLLALLSGSVMTGIGAFVFSTVVITLVGEIVPQAWFSRHALPAAAALAPVVRLYQFLLYPVARPTALLLDRWLGREAIVYYEESDIKDLLRLHARAADSEIGWMESQGALNFLDLDDVPIADEGEVVEAASIVAVEFADNRPVLPTVAADPDDAFLRKVNDAGTKWVVLVDGTGEARAVLDADAFIRDALFRHETFNPYTYCHRPIIVKDGATPLGHLVPRLAVEPAHAEDDVVEKDIILLWGAERRIVTGSDILGRLLRGVVRAEAGGGRPAP